MNRERSADNFPPSAEDWPNALRDGLDGHENRELFRSLDRVQIAELVLTGLERLWM